jgi:hypothetical protein
MSQFTDAPNIEVAVEVASLVTLMATRMTSYMFS